MTTPAALTPALAAWVTTSSREACCHLCDRRDIVEKSDQSDAQGNLPSFQNLGGGAGSDTAKQMGRRPLWVISGQTTLSQTPPLSALVYSGHSRAQSKSPLSPMADIGRCCALSFRGSQASPIKWPDKVDQLYFRYCIGSAQSDAREQCRRTPSTSE